MLDIKEHCDDTLPTELCGIKFRKGWYYLVDKKILEPYICEDEKDTDYKSIVIYLDCDEFPAMGDVVYDAIFFTNIKHVGISGRICAVRKDLKDKAAAREEFLKKLQETLPKLNLKVDKDALIKHRDKHLDTMLKKADKAMKDADKFMKKNGFKIFGE